VCDALSSQAFRHAIKRHSKAVLTAGSRPTAASRRWRDSKSGSCDVAAGAVFMTRNVDVDVDVF